MLNERQLQILGAIIQEYVATAEPVASKVIVDKYGFDISSATVRNDMAFLEAEGLLRQPYTSAGRVPTEDGYRLFLERFVRSKDPVRVSAPLRKAIEGKSEPQDQMRRLAKSLSELTGQAALMAVDSNWNYYTGLSQLMENPEFADVSILKEFSKAVDRMDEVMADVFEGANKEMNVWLGDENPFGHDLATLLVRYRLPGGRTGIIGLIGPQRMDYERNLQLLAQARELLNEDEN
jgi:heat-inducible transcriptional repressor